jgi:hypothetical protein
VVSGFRAALGRLMVAVMAATVLVPTVAFAWGSVVHASVDCQMGQSDWYEVSVTSTDLLFTHNLAYASLAPGGNASRTITVSNTYTGSITITVGTSAEGSIIIAKASLEVGFSLKGEYSRTDSDSHTDGITNNTSNNHKYVFFEGTKNATGRFTQYYCSVGVAKVRSSGTWKSWHGMDFGVLRCDQDARIATDFGAWSIEHEAVLTC